MLGFLWALLYFPQWNMLYQTSRKLTACLSLSPAYLLFQYSPLIFPLRFFFLFLCVPTLCSLPYFLPSSCSFLVSSPLFLFFMTSLSPFPLVDPTPASLQPLPTAAPFVLRISWGSPFSAFCNTVRTRKPKLSQ